MIELRNLSKTYILKEKPVLALDNINLNVRKGEIFGVIGPSGAGKSTLIRCVNLLESPSQGQVIIDGQDLTTLSEAELRLARRNIGMIFQSFNLLTSRTVYKNVAVPLELAGMTETSQRKIILPLLELTGLLEKQHNYPSQLSGGQKQRVAIARALANHPKVLLSDEATSSLDPETTHNILQLLKKINEQFGLTILLITHEMSVVKEICHHLAIIENGRIIEQNEVISFFSRPQTAIAKKFIRSTITQTLPDAVKQRMVKDPLPDTNPLLRISFIGKIAQEPWISDCVTKFSIVINILQANIEQIRDTTVGWMLVEIKGKNTNIERAIEDLRTKDVTIELIGYAKSID